MKRVVAVLVVVAVVAVVGLAAVPGDATADTRDANWTVLTQDGSTANSYYQYKAATPHPTNRSFIAGYRRTVPCCSDNGMREFSMNFRGSRDGFRQLQDGSTRPGRNGFAFNPAGTLIADAGSQAIVAYGNGSSVESLTDMNAPVAWSPDGNYLAYRDGNNQPLVRRSDTWANVDATSHSGGVFAWATDTGMFAVQEDASNISIRDPATGFGQTNRIELNNATDAIKLSNDSSELYSMTADSVEVHDVSTGQQTNHIAVVSDLEAMDLSNDGQRLALSNSSGVISIYHTDDWTLEERFNPEYHQQYTHVEWGWQSTYLVASSNYGYTTLTHKPVVTGRVTNTSGVPLGGARLTARNHSRETKTNSSGYYQLLVPEPGDYNVQMTYAKDQYAGVEKPVNVPSEGVDLPFTQVQTYSTAVTGFVFDEQGAPVEYARVEVDGNTVRTWHDGFYVAGVSSAGLYDIDYDAKGYYPETKQNVDIPQTALLGFNVTLEAPDGSLIKGEVIDEDTGDPVPGATVASGLSETFTDINGTFTLEVSGPGIHHVTASNAIDSDVKTLNVTGDELNGITFELATPNQSVGYGTLWVRSEQTGRLINNRSVELNVFGNDSSAQYDTSTGAFHLGRVTQGEPFVVTGHALGYETRRIIVDDRNNSQNLFLLENAEVDQSFFTEFQLQDLTGEFSDSPRLYIERSMPLPGESTDIPYRVLLSDFFGADEQVGLLMEGDARHRIIIENEEGDIRELGSYTASRERTVPLQIADIEWELGNKEDVVLWDASRVNETVVGDALRFQLSDEGNRTTDLTVKMFETDNKSREIYNQTHSGPFGNISILQPIPANATNVTSWTIQWNATQGFKQIGASKIVGPGEYEPNADSQWFQIFATVFIVFIAGMFSVRLAAVGAVIVPLVGLFLWTMGWLPVPLPWVLAALALGVAAEFANRGGFSDKP